MKSKQNGYYLPTNLAPAENQYPGHSQVKHLTLMVDATNICQLGCSYCYFGEKGCKLMNPDLIFQATKNFVEAIGPQVELVNLHYMGGEPLIGWEKILILNQTMTNYAQEKGFRFIWSLTSNLVELDEEKKEHMLKEKAEIHCSIDGPQFIQDNNRPFKSGSGSFAIVDKHIDNALEISPNDFARVTVTPFSSHYLPEITSYLFNKGFPGIGLYPAENMTWEEGDLEAWSTGIRKSFELAKEKDKILSTVVHPHKNNRSFSYCGAARSLWGLDVEGKLYSCHHFTNHPEKAIIDAANSSAEEIKASINRPYLAPQNIQLPTACQDCPASDYCYGGCWADNETKSGNAYLPNSISCTFQKITFNSLQDYILDPAIDTKIENYCMICGQCQRMTCCSCNGCVKCDYSCNKGQGKCWVFD